MTFRTLLVLCSCLALLQRGAPQEAEDGTCSSATCRQASGNSLTDDASVRSCEERYASLPGREKFFSRVEIPPEVEEKKFREMLAKGGIHPRGVILNSEFYELPLELNHSALETEVAALLDGQDFEEADKANEKQGVSSRHFRLTQSTGNGDLDGPFAEKDQRLERSPYIRAVLAALGGVVGNVALMSLEPGGLVDAHFDTNKYWHSRVRIHIPVRTNKHVKFSCGQRGEMHELQMKKGKAYVFDNHLGHSVENKGKSDRVHLTVDMVGSRSFWELVSRSNAIGNSPKKGSGPLVKVVAGESAVVAIESWQDKELQHEGFKEGCSADAGSAWAAVMSSVASQLDLGEEGRSLAEAWCHELRQSPGRSRLEEVRTLRRLAAAKACRGGSPGLVEVADTLAEIHRAADADSELGIIGGEVQK